MENSPEIINENEVLRKYFRFRHSSLMKAAYDVEKYNKFREKWTIFFKKADPKNVLGDNKNENIKTFIKRNTIAGTVYNTFNTNSTSNKILITKESKKSMINNENEIPMIVKKGGVNFEVKKNSIKSPERVKENFRNKSNLISSNSNQKNILDPNRTKTFICIGGYPAIRKALVERGWQEIEDGNSLNFDLKWVLKTKDIQPANQLRKDQIVNHFLNNIEITKKSGLQKNLRNMVYKNIDIDNFYPRSYELSERNDFEDFLEDFKTMKAVALIKQFHSGQRDNMQEEMLLTALSIMDRKLTYFENYEEESLKIIWDRNNYFLNARNQKLISDSEWFCISEEDVRNYTKEIEKLEKMNKIGYLKIEKDKKLSSTKINFTNKENNSLPLSDNPEVLQKYKEIISSYFQRMQNILPQFYLNGANNIWILKPSGLSRGRGIICMNSLNDILDLIKKNSNQYIAQKYIENPLIILGRKFDIRQWVLVTDLNPLTIWMYDTPYVRFGAEDYKLEDFSNLFSHLTNNSVVKYSKNFNDTKIEGNMWDCSQLSDFLKANYGRDVWKEELQEKIKKIVICSLESAKNGITQRKNSHELFGYDIMVDDQLNSWLIEVNSSPAMDYSTSITEKLVKEMSEDLIKVVVDHNLADKNERSQINTGKWIKIHEGKFEEENFLPNLNN